MLMNRFAPNVEFSDENEKRGFSNIYDMLSIKITEVSKIPKTVKFVDLVRRFSKEYLTVEFQLIWF